MQAQQIVNVLLRGKGNKKMKTNRLNLVLILTSMTLLGACAEEEKKENLAMTDKKEQSKIPISTPLPHQMFSLYTLAWVTN